MDIVAVGYAGDKGATKIAKKKQDELKKIYRADIIANMIVSYKLDISKADDIADSMKAEIISAGDGGILASLYEMAVSRQCGINIRMRDIPIRWETIEICEIYDINPYRLSSDMRIYLTKGSHHMIEELDKINIPSAVIGHTHESLDKIIIDKKEIEYINKPTKDELYKVMGG